MANRPGTQGACQLLNNPHIDEWISALSNYDDAVARVATSKKKPELVSLDKWMWKDFPQLVQGRSPPSCTKEELTRVMQWKLLRGKNRPALLNFIKQNSEDSVQTVSQEAFLLLSNNSWKSALAKMTELRGVGPATASALLAPLDSSVPFMADEPLEAVSGTKRDYSTTAYCSLHSGLRLLVDSTLGEAMTSEEAGKALWTAAMLSIHAPNERTSSSTDTKSKDFPDNVELSPTSTNISTECVGVPKSDGKRKAAVEKDLIGDSRVERRMKRERFQAEMQSR